MTDQEKAQAWLQEQMGEGWGCHLYAPGDDGLGGISDNGAAQRGWWLAEAEHGECVHVGVQGHDPMSAARACWEAWREATRREVMPCNCAELPAERAHADRLAERMRQRSEWFGEQVESLILFGSMSASVIEGRLRDWAAMSSAWKAEDAAHDARRAGEGR